MIAGLLIGLAWAAPPEVLRDDASVVFGCPSRAALDASIPSLPAAIGQDLAGSVGMLRTFGVDESMPFWLVLDEINGQLLPVQFIFHVPEGVKPPTMLLRMLPGSPRVAQEGTQVSVVMGGPKRGESSGVVALMEGVSQGKDGCALGALKDPTAGIPVTLALGMGTDGHNRALMLLEEGDEGSVLALAGGVPASLAPTLLDVLRAPEAAPREAWASTPVVPATAMRLNNRVPLLPLVETLYADPTTIPKFVHKVELEAGAEISLRQVDGKLSEWALVAPVHRPRNVCWWPGRIAASARKSGLEVQKHKRVFGIPQADGTLWVTSKKRRFIAASSREAAEALRDPDVGRAWFADPDVGEVDAPGALFRLPMRDGGAALGRVLPAGEDRIVVDYRVVPAESARP